MKNYRVHFYRKDKEEDEYLGNVVVDDVGVDDTNMTVESKAFRHALEQCLRADKIYIERI